MTTEQIAATLRCATVDGRPNHAVALSAPLQLPDAESADWFDAGYLIMWGSNVPVTRTPDAHYMTEARYRGQKVIVVSPDYADNTKFADEWLPARPGTDAALAMSMGHVILKEFFVDRTTAYFSDYVKKYTDLPFLVTLAERDGDWLPGKFLTAADLGDTSEGGSSKTVLLDAQANPVVPNGSLGHRFTASGEGKWNLDLQGVDPLLTLHGTHSDVTAVKLPRFDGDRPGVLTRGVPTKIIAGQRVTTVFDLLLAQYGVYREGLPGDWPTGYDDATQPYTPAWQEPITGVPAKAAERIAREFADNAERSRGRSMILMGAGNQPLVSFRPDLSLVPHACDTDRLSGSQRRRLGALRRPGEVPTGDGMVDAGFRVGLAAAAPADAGHGVLVPVDRPVALRPFHLGGDGIPAGRGPVYGPNGGRQHRAGEPAGLDAELSDVQSQSAGSGG